MLLSASSGIPVSSYIYTSDNEAVAAPDPFRVTSVVYPENEESEYTDFMIKDGVLYILDAGTQTLRNIEGGGVGFFDSEGLPWSFGRASGLFISDDLVYVADSGKCEVAIFDRTDLSIVRVIRDPDTSALGTTQPFVPSKVLADRAGNVYVLVDDLYYGALLFSPAGEFLGYFGANPTELTFTQRLDQKWKKLLNRNQRDAMERFVPVAYSGFDIDDEDFVYTCSFNITNESMKIRRINPSGNGRWDSRNLSFGDMIPATDAVEGLENTSRFVDVDIHDGILTALDAARGRIFSYDADGNLISIIGGKGSQKGVFTNPQKVESDDDAIYVLDESDSSITVFERTYYGDMLFSAVSLYDDGAYVDAIPYWNEVLRIDPQLELAHLGLGKAYQKLGLDEEALAELRLSGNREQYSDVFDSIRLDWARRNLSVVVLIVVLVSAAYLVATRRFGWKMFLPSGFTAVFQPLLHPSDEMWELKRKKRFSIPLAVTLLAIFFFLDILSFFTTGYAFNENDPEDFNILLSIMDTIGFFLLWTITNWGVSTISDGKGTLKDIFCASSYALIPLIGAGIVNLVLSHVLTLDEAVFITWIRIFSLVWGAAVLLVTLSTIHEYTFSRTVGNVLLTILGMAFILFLMFLSVVLVENTVNIFSIIYNEIVLRR